MVDERTAYWGDRDAARYRTQDDDPTGGDYVVAETLDANGDPVDVLLRWDDTAGEWVSGGPVNMNGSDVTNVGALNADSVSTGQINFLGGLNPSEFGFCETIPGTSSVVFFSKTIASFVSLITARAGDDTAQAVIGGRTKAAPDARVLVRSGDFPIEATTQDVSGATGTNGAVTVSIRDGTIEVENQVGGSCRVSMRLVDDGG